MEKETEKQKNNAESESNLKIEFRENGVVVIRPEGPLKAEDFAQLSAVVDPWIKTHKDLLGVVVSVKKFPGWEDFGSLIRHIEFVRAHHRLVSRVALNMDGVLPEVMSFLASHLVKAEVKQFPYLAETQSLEWVTAGKAA